MNWRKKNNINEAISRQNYSSGKQWRTYRMLFATEFLKVDLRVYSSEVSFPYLITTPSKRKTWLAHLRSRAHDRGNTQRRWQGLSLFDKNILKLLWMAKTTDFTKCFQKHYRQQTSLLSLPKTSWEDEIGVKSLGIFIEEGVKANDAIASFWRVFSKRTTMWLNLAHKSKIKIMQRHF